MSGSEEFFYIENGKKQDKKLHEPILNNDQADRFCQMRSRQSLKGKFPEELLDRLFPKSKQNGKQ